MGTALTMRVIEKPEEVRSEVGRLRGEGKKVGFVPTMGFLHAGHVSLIEAARRECDAVVVSIFVNPIQFGPKEDFAKYPRDMARDKALCEEAGADIIFAPEAHSMYPAGFQTVVSVGTLAEPLCGAARPGHFIGVATVVAKLFNVVLPDRAYFGEKDFQQLQVIRRMATDLNMAVEVVGMPIVREPDGLAMSSRNVYLSPEERQRALCLSRSLDSARAMYGEGERSASAILEKVNAVLAEAGVTAEYAEIRDAATLENVTEIKAPAVLALAARVGATRLIDNTVLGK